MGRTYLRTPIVSLLSAVGLAIILVLALFFFCPFAPPEPMALAFRFIADLQNGRIDDAYKLTDQGSDVGTNVRVFGANEDVVFLVSSKHPVFLEWVHPTQSRAQRIVRIIRRVQVDPDVLYVNFYVGLPFLVRLQHTRRGWTVSYFEVHAE
jgi:hypothetical protein